MDSMYFSALITPGLVRFGLPSLSMLPPEAQTHDMTSFWTPLGSCKASGSTQPYWFFDGLVSFFASAKNSLLVVGGFVIPAALNRSRLMKTG